MTFNLYSVDQSPLLTIRYLGCNTLPDTVNIGPLLRNSYIIHYVIKGKGYYNGIPVHTGQGFLIYPGHIEKYWADPSDPWELVWIVSEDERMKDIFPYYNAEESTGIFDFSGTESIKLVARQIALRHRKIISSTELLGMFLNCFAIHTPCSISNTTAENSDAYVDFAIQFIHNNYNAPITVFDLTQLLGISSPYLLRIFKAKTGRSPKQYISDYRILQAKYLLCNTELSIAEIAHSVGFSDPLSFSHFFTKKAGCSAKDFRKNSI